MKQEGWIIIGVVLILLAWQMNFFGLFSIIDFTAVDIQEFTWNNTNWEAQSSIIINEVDSVKCGDPRGQSDEYIYGTSKTSVLYNGILEIKGENYQPANCDPNNPKIIVMSKNLNIDNSLEELLINMEINANSVMNGQGETIWVGLIDEDLNGQTLASIGAANGNNNNLKDIRLKKALTEGYIVEYSTTSQPQTRTINLEEGKNYELYFKIEMYGFVDWDLGNNGNIKINNIQLTKTIINETDNQTIIDDDNQTIIIDENTTITCPFGFTYNFETDKCEKYPGTEIKCTQGTYNSLTGKCEIYPDEEILPPFQSFFETTLYTTSNGYEIKMWQAGIVLLILLALLLTGGRRK